MPKDKDLVIFDVKLFTKIIICFKILLEDQEL